jgi:folylpolyglutamate synthase/dihydropteroate synthase
VLLTEAEPGGGLPNGIGAWPVTPDPEAAVRQALSMCPVGGTVIIAGSMYLAGRVRAFLRRASTMPDTLGTHG